MSKQNENLSAMRRPRLMIRAARHGLEFYNRNTALRRLLRMETPPGHEKALERLLIEEERLEMARQDRSGTYSFERHIDFLIAIMAEARLLPTRV